MTGGVGAVEPPRRRRYVPVVLMLGLGLSMTWGRASAVCAEPEDPPLTIRQMIHSGSTGDRYFDTLFLGRVRKIHDPGIRDPSRVARFSVRAHPIGWTPHRARVEFGRLSEDAVFHLHRRYVVVAHRQRGGRFVSDGVCGLTRELNRTQLRKLLRVVRSHGD